MSNFRLLFLLVGVLGPLVTLGAEPNVGPTPEQVADRCVEAFRNTLVDLPFGILNGYREKLDETRLVNEMFLVYEKTIENKKLACCPFPHGKPKLFGRECSLVRTDGRGSPGKKNFEDLVTGMGLKICEGNPLDSKWMEFAWGMACSHDCTDGKCKETTGWPGSFLDDAVCAATHSSREVRDYLKLANELRESLAEHMAAVTPEVPAAEEPVEPPPPIETKDSAVHLEEAAGDPSAAPGGRGLSGRERGNSPTGRPVLCPESSSGGTEFDGGRVYRVWVRSTGGSYALSGPPTGSNTEGVSCQSVVLGRESGSWFVRGVVQPGNGRRGTLESSSILGAALLPRPNVEGAAHSRIDYPIDPMALYDVVRGSDGTLWYLARDCAGQKEIRDQLDACTRQLNHELEHEGASRGSRDCLLNFSVRLKPAPNAPAAQLPLALNIDTDAITDIFSGAGGPVVAGGGSP